MTSETLEAARAAWVDAEQRAEQFAQDDREKAAKWRAALAHLDGIPERIVSGEQLHKADLTQAKAAAADAKNNSTMAEAMARAGRKKANEAQVAFLEAEGEYLRAEYSETVSEYIEAMIAVDKAVSAARRAVDAAHALEGKRQAIAEQARRHDEQVSALGGAPGTSGQRNPFLTETHRSTWPMARLPASAAAILPAVRVEIVTTERGIRQAFTGMFDVVHTRSAEDLARLYYQLPAPLAEVNKAA